MKDFVGRSQDLAQLADLKRKKTGSLITMQGRRRIGKSTLIRHFCVTEKLPCFEFQGLPPRTGQSNRAQLDELAATLSKYLGAPKSKFTDWREAFEYLNLLCLKNAGLKTKYVVLLDEISWMESRHRRVQTFAIIPAIGPFKNASRRLIPAGILRSSI